MSVSSINYAFVSVNVTACLASISLNDWIRVFIKFQCLCEILGSQRLCLLKFFRGIQILLVLICKHSECGIDLDF